MVGLMRAKVYLPYTDYLINRIDKSVDKIYLPDNQMLFAMSSRLFASDKPNFFLKR